MKRTLMLAAAVAALLAGTTYFWRVVARKGEASATSQTWSFTTAAVPSALAPSPAKERLTPL